MITTAQKVSIGQAAKVLKVSLETLRRWEKKGLIMPIRSPKGTRYYDLNQLRELKKNSHHQKVHASSLRLVAAGVTNSSQNKPQPTLDLLAPQPKTDSHKDSWNQVYAIINKEQKNSLKLKRIYPRQEEINIPHLNSDLRTFRKNIMPVYLTSFAILLIIPFLTISLLTISNLLSPLKTQSFTQNQAFFPPFNRTAAKIAMTLSPQLGYSLPLKDSAIARSEATKQSQNNDNGQVLAEETVAQFLEINSDTTIKGNLTAENLNGINITSSETGITISDTVNNRSVTITGTDITLDQSLLTSSSTTLSGLNLTATSNQLVLGPTGGITGTLTWTPTSSSKIITLPNITDTLVGKTTTDTFSNKTIKSGDSNTISGSFPDITGITSLGTVSTGTWNGTKIGTGYGGTGLTTYTTGDLIYSNASNTLSKLSIGTAGQYLTVSSGIPAWSSLAGSTITVQEGDTTTSSATGTLDFLGGDFNLTESPSGEVNVTLASTLTTPTGVSGDWAVAGGDLTSSATTFNLLNSTVTTLNLGGAATTLSLGASTGTTTVNNALTSTGLITANAGLTIASGQSLTVTGNVASVLLPSANNTYDLGSATYQWQDAWLAGNLTVAGNLITSGTTSGAWSSASGVVYPTNSTTDDVAIGGTTSSAPFFVDGATGATTIAPDTGSTTALTLKAAPSGTANIFSVQSNDAGTTYFAIDSAGKLSSSAFQLTDINNAIVGTAIANGWANVGGVAENDFTYRRTLTVTNNDGSTALPLNYEVTLALTSSTASDVCDYSQSDADDIRLYYSADGSTMTQINRNITRTCDGTTGGGTDTVDITFQLQRAISASSASGGTGEAYSYYLYYSNSSLTGGSSWTYTSGDTTLDNAETIGNWSSTDDTNFALSANSSSPSPSQGTYSVKAVAVAQSAPGNIGAFSTSSQGQLLSGHNYSAAVTATYGGTTYLYFIAGRGSSAVYKATINSSGDLETFDTSSQGQMLRSENVDIGASTVTYGGTTYIYVIAGGWASSVVYKATIDPATANIGTFDTASQAQLPQTRKGHAQVTATYGGTTYIYVIGGDNNGVPYYSTVYKATIDPATANIGTFDTASQAQLPVAMVKSAATTVTIGGTTYVYILGGYDGSTYYSTVYKATIDPATANIGTFDTASQAQLPQGLYYLSATTVAVNGTNYIYTIGGTTTGAVSVSTVYRATIDSSGNITGTFDTTSQGQLPLQDDSAPAIATASIGGSNYIYKLGGYYAGQAKSTVYKASISTPPVFTATSNLGSTTYDLSTKNSITFDVFTPASGGRTGGYANFEFYDSGSAAWQSTAYSITGTGAWETKTWDISAVASASKNEVTQIRFNITDNTAGFTMYFDNIIAKAAAFTGTAPTISAGNKTLGAANLAVNAQGTGSVNINHDATSSLAGTGGLKVYDGASTSVFSVSGSTGGLTIAGTAGGITFSGSGNHDISASSGTLRLGAFTGTGATIFNGGTVRVGGYSLCVKSTDAACAGSTAGAIYASNTTVQSADVAENYISANNLEAGDVVIPANDGNNLAISQSQSPYQKEVLGVVSTKPGVTLNSDAATDSAHPYIYPIALAGRVPIKVSTESGVIKAGDYLTSSSIPGVAMKAIRPGQVIGKALEDYDGSQPEYAVNDEPTNQLTNNTTGKILAFVNPSFADPTDLLSTLALDPSGNLISIPPTNPLLSSSPLPDTISSTTTLRQAQGLWPTTSSVHTVTQPNTSLLDLKTEMASMSARLAKLESSSSGLLALTESSSSASPSASLALSDVLGLDTILESTPSASFASDSLDSRLLTLDSLSVSSSLKVYGDTTLSNTLIAGSLTIDGMMNINSDSISSIGTLYLQNGPLDDLVDLFNGKVTIDKEGKISVEKIEVGSKTLGTGILPGGKTRITIYTDQLTSRSQIFITSHKPVPLAVTDKDFTLGSFTVETDRLLTEDLVFDWWIIDNKN